MKVKINYLGLVKTYTNRNQDEKELPEETALSELLDQLSSEFGKPFNPEIYDPNKKEVKPMFVVMINGVLIDQRGIETKLKNGDEVVVMPLMTGG